MSGAKPSSPPRDRVGEDHAALAAVSETGGALCTIVGIEGSFSRQLGAQLAIRPDGTLAGDLADGCLEQQLKTDCSKSPAPRIVRYGRGSDRIDFRLPCGGGLDILIDPHPDRSACGAALAHLRHRREATLVLEADERSVVRHYIPRLIVRLFGEGPELEAVVRIAEAAGIACEPVDRSQLSLGRPSGFPAADRWTAVVTLFHDHEWEASLLEEALLSDAFYVGAQGGHKARSARLDELARRGLEDDVLQRLRGPIGVPSGSRTPDALALSVLAEIAGEYENLRPQP